MRKIKQGGVLGRNLKHARKVNLLGLALFSFMLLFSAITFANAHGHGSVVGGVTTAAFAGLGVMHRDPAPGGAGGGGADKTDEEKALEKIQLLTKSLVDKEVLATKGLIDNLEKRLNAINTDELKADVTKALSELKALKERGLETKDGEKVSLKKAIFAALEEKKDIIDLIVKRGGKMDGPLMLEVKAAIPESMTATILAGGSASHYSLTSNTGIISKIRKRLLTYLENVSIGGLSVDKPYAMWIEELDEQGTPIFIAEGAAKTQLSVRYEEREKKAKKIAIYGKVTTEFLKYLPQLVSYVETNLMRRAEQVTEDQLINGDDTGDNLKGILRYATAFDGGVGTAGEAGLVGAVFNPSDFDVIRAIALQVFNSYGEAGVIFIAASKLAEMDVAKDTQGRYLLPPFKTAGGTSVAGVELKPTNALVGTGYDWVGGDLSVVHVEFLENMSIQIGLDGNDFTQNKKTILMEQQLVQFVSANDTQVLIKGDFTTAKALLNVSNP